MTKGEAFLKHLERIGRRMTSMLFGKHTAERLRLESSVQLHLLRRLSPPGTSWAKSQIVHSTAKLRYEQLKRVARLQKNKKFKEAWNKSRAEHFLTWIHGAQRQHFGPRSRIPDLFERRDWTYFALQSQQLRWRFPAPRTYHDFFDAAVKVARVENIIGYHFKDKMLCIEALKVTGSHSPLFFDGTIRNVEPNNRLALLGDRVLSLAICEMWYRTGGRPKDYAELGQDIVSRAALASRGRGLGFHEIVLRPNGLSNASSNHIAETFEALLGAVYVDSGNRLSSVIEVIKKLGLDDHRLLKMPDM